MEKWKKEDTIIISDIHLGSRGSKAEELLDFLNELLKNPPKRIVIAGDLFELWSTNYKKIGKFEYGVIRKFIELSENDVKIVYIPGNHDRALSAFQKFTFGKIKIRNEYIIKDGNKKFVVLHGDEFDPFTRNHIILSLLLDKLYVGLIKVTTFFKTLFRINFTLADKKKSKKYKKIVEKIKKAALAYARAKKVDGIIVGHTHWPEKDSVNGVTYVNSGDWIDSYSYVVIGDEVSLKYYQK